MMIALYYKSGSPLLKKYLEINGYVAVQIWPSSTGRGYDVMMMNGESTGGVEVSQRLRRDAIEIAKNLAKHCGLPLRKSGR
jgi:hypothetical protein